MNKEHKNIVGIVVLAVAILLLVGLLLWNTLKNDDEMSIDTYEAQQLELFSAAVYEDLEVAKGMEYAEAQDYIITSLNENRRTYSSDSVDLASLKMLNLTTDDISNSTSSLLDELGSMLDGFDIGNLLGGLFGENNGSSMRTLTMKSNTVCQAVADQKYCVDKLSANVYITDVNSNKWAVLLHGMMMSGSLIYNSIGSMYEAQGYNIIAPDLRGFGDSDGSVAMGYLESLDVYDWIKDLNINWSNRYGVNVAPNTIVVHGISLGGATTLQLATNPDIAAANGTEPYTKNLTELKVKGFVDDCGYTSMSGIITGMLSGGDTAQMSSLFGSFDIDKIDFMSKLQDLLESSNIGGFDSYDFDNLLDSNNSNGKDYFKYFNQFSAQFNKIEDAINKYAQSNTQYQNQIPGIDKNTWENLVDKYGKYSSNYNGGIPNLFPTNSSVNVNPVLINNSLSGSSNVLDGLIGKVLMSLVGVGLTDDNYDKYSNVFSLGRKFPAGSKVVIIHGTSDTTVPHSNADTVSANVAPATLVHKWDANGMPHAFVVVGSSKSEYTNLIANFTSCVNNSNCKSISR